jgi:Flp pilus assembly protein TadB
MQRYRDRLPVVAAALLVAATILFVVGTSIERSQARAGEQQAASTNERPAGEAGEHSEAEATEGGSNATSEATDEHASSGESGEELLGINPESVGLTVIVAAVSLLLAALLVARPRTGLLVAVVVVGLVFAVLDVREGIHQASESNTGLLVVALVTGLLHLGVAVAAAAGLRTPRAVALTS